MKFRNLLCLFVCFSIFLFAGCESTNDLRCAYFSNITAPGSSNNALKVTYQKDSRVDEKYVDVQVKSNRECQIEFHKENEEAIDLVFYDTKWNSLTTLICDAQGRENQESFKKYKETASQTFILATNYNDVFLTFRVVVGDSIENAGGTGFILTNAKEVSDEFKVNLVKRTT